MIVIGDHRDLHHIAGDGSTMGNQPTSRKRKHRRSCLATGPESVSLTSVFGGDIGPSFEASSAVAEEVRPVVQKVGDFEEKRKKKRRRRNDDFLCTTFCDLLFDLPELSPWQPVDTKFIVKVLAALGNCNQDHRNADVEGTYTTDLRGRSRNEAKRALVSNLNCWSRLSSIKYLNVLVGCKDHGGRQGKLGDMVCELLGKDSDISWKYDNDVMISIELDAEKDYNSLLWDLNGCPWNEKGDIVISEASRLTACDGHSDHDRPSVAELDEEAMQEIGDLVDSPWLPALEKEVMGEISALRDVYKSSQKDFLCTISCDFLLGLPTPSGQCWERTILKVLAGLKKCCPGDSYEDIDGFSYTIDIRGRHVDETEKMLIEQLNCYHDLRYINVIVGCKVHGIGEGKLKNMICDLLKRDKTINFKDKAYVITIQLDGRKDYTSLGWVSQPLVNTEHSSCGTAMVFPANENPVSSSDQSDVDTSIWAASEVGSDVEEEVVSHIAALRGVYEPFEDSMCTFVCDFLSDLPTPPGQWWDEETTQKILSVLRKCDGDNSIEDDAEASFTIDVRGRYANEAKVLLGELMKHLLGQSGVKYLNVIIGCKVHGIGKGKLKDVVIQLLKDDLNTKYASTRDFIISIELEVGLIPRVEKMISKIKNPLFSYPSSSKSVSPAASYDYIDGGESSPVEMVAGGQEREMMVLEPARSTNDSLCCILSDLLFDLPELPPYQQWDAKLIVKVLAALDKCHHDDWEDEIDGIYTTDLRGRSSNEAKKALVSNLNSWARLPSIKYLNVLVGCKKHGVGKGKLKNAVSDLLKTDDNITWTFESEVIISIQLEDEKDYNFLLDSIKPK